MINKVHNPCCYLFYINEANIAQVLMSISVISQIGTVIIACLQQLFFVYTAPDSKNVLYI